MANRKRNIMIRFRVTPEEKSLIEEKMTQVGTSNMEAYLRKMSIDGYILKLDLPELKSNYNNKGVVYDKKEILLFHNTCDYVKLSGGDSGWKHSAVPADQFCKRQCNPLFGCPVYSHNSHLRNRVGNTSHSNNMEYVRACDYLGTDPGGRFRRYYDYVCTNDPVAKADGDQ